MDPNPTQAPQSQSSNPAVTEPQPSQAPVAPVSLIIHESTVTVVHSLHADQSTHHQPTSSPARHSPSSNQANPLVSIMSRVIGGGQNTTGAKSVIDIIDLDQQDDAPVETTNAQAVRSTTAKNEHTNAHTEGLVQTHVTQKTVQFSIPINQIVEPVQQQNKPLQQSHISEPIVQTETHSHPTFPIPHIQNKQPLAQNTVGIARQITEMHDSQTPTFKHATLQIGPSLNETVMMNQMPAVNVQQCNNTIVKPSSPLLSAIAGNQSATIEHVPNEITIQHAEHVSNNINTQQQHQSQRQEQSHDHQNNLNVEHTNQIIEEPQVSHHIQQPTQAHLTRDQQINHSIQELERLHIDEQHPEQPIASSEQQQPQQQQVPHNVQQTHHKINAQIEQHQPVDHHNVDHHHTVHDHHIQHEPVQHQHHHTADHHNNEHNNQMQLVPVSTAQTQTQPVVRVQIVQPPVVIPLPCIQEINVNVQIRQEQSQQSQPQQQVAAQHEPVTVAVDQIQQEVPQVASNQSSSVPVQVDHNNQQVQQTQTQHQQVQQQQQVNQPVENQQPQLVNPQQQQIQLLEQVPQVPPQQQQQPTQISQPIQFSISAQSPQLTDINQIRKMLLKYLPPHLKELTQTLADDQLRDMYLEIRSEQMRVAAAQASIMNQQQSIQVKDKKDQGKKSPQGKSAHENNHNKKKDSPKKQRDTQPKKSTPSSTASNNMTDNNHNNIHQQSKSNAPLPSSSSTAKQPINVTNTGSNQARKSRRQRKRVVTTVVQQVQYYDDSDAETPPSKTMMMENGEIRKKKPATKAQMHNILNQLCTLVKSLDLTALGANANGTVNESNGV